MKSDVAFLRDLEASRGRVSRFCSIQRASGVNIWQGPEVTRPTARVRHDFADSGDFMLIVRGEHKVRNFDFTSADDFPHPTLIVAETYSIERQAANPFVYVIESRDGRHAAVVHSRQMARWTKSRRYDAAQQRECEYYEAPLETVRFCEVGEVFR